MNLILWVAAGLIASSLAVALLFGLQTGRDAGLGLLGPLVAMICTWIAVERTHRRRPEGVTPVMIKAFAAKMVFFAAYITVILRTELVEPVPFVISFTIYYLALQITAAIALRRLTAA
ncbi:MAG: hypothetical protein HY646_04255 [Acidobacteria bacterium]|nr:hypothetical protein [Acidobacteriota bacterium]